MGVKTPAQNFLRVPISDQMPSGITHTLSYEVEKVGRISKFVPFLVDGKLKGRGNI